jgi:hypothetical protein
MYAARRRRRNKNTLHCWQGILTNFPFKKLSNLSHIPGAFCIFRIVSLYNLCNVSNYVPKIPLKRGKACVRLSYQYYKFDYTRSNNWVGAPMNMSDVTAATPQFLVPIKNAKDIYLTFDVQF